MTERLNPFGFNAFGHYSQGVKIDLGTKTMIITAGQIALDDDGKPVAPGDFTAQTRFVSSSDVFSRCWKRQVRASMMSSKPSFLSRMSGNTVKFLPFGTSILLPHARPVPWSKSAIQ